MKNKTEKPQRTYIAGKMTGLKYFGFQLFDDAAFKLRKAGFKPVSPAELDRLAGFDPVTDLPEDWDWNVLPPQLDKREIIARDVTAIQSCDSYVLLPNWSDSVGATSEKALLDWMGATRYDLETLKPHVTTNKFEGCAVCDLKRSNLIQDNWFSNWFSNWLSHSHPENTACECGKTQPVNGSKPNDDAGEIRITDPITGGQKGKKLERFDLIPAEPLEELARVYGRGAEKYDDHNWTKGYQWGLSFGAMMRHAWKFWRGETYDELGNHHLGCVAWHCFTLMWYEKNKVGTDDRKISMKPLDADC